MLSNFLFAEAYRKVCYAFNKPADEKQAEFFYTQLKGFRDENLGAVVDVLVKMQRAPSLSEWNAAFVVEARKCVGASTTRPFGRCPKCKSDTMSRRFPDGEYYEVCMDCSWREILYTFDEWRALEGFDGLNPIEACMALRNRRLL